MIMLKTKETYAQLMFRTAYRNLRKSMKDPAELAWRLRADFKHCAPSAYTFYHNHACAAMYARSMPMPKTDSPNPIH